MPEPSVEDMLANVRIAINALVTGGAVQMYMIAGRQIQHFSLTELLNLERQLVARQASSTGTLGRTFVTFENPT